MYSVSSSILLFFSGSGVSSRLPFVSFANLQAFLSVHRPLVSAQSRRGQGFSVRGAARDLSDVLHARSKVRLSCGGRREGDTTPHTTMTGVQLTRESLACLADRALPLPRCLLPRPTSPTSPCLSSSSSSTVIASRPGNCSPQVHLIPSRSEWVHKPLPARWEVQISLIMEVFSIHVFYLHRRCVIRNYALTLLIVYVIHRLYIYIAIYSFSFFFFIV